MAAQNPADQPSSGRVGLRSVGTVVAGLLAFGLTVAAIESLGHAIYPPPALSPERPDAIKLYLESAPIGALLFVVVAQMAGGLVGPVVAAVLSPSSRSWPVVVVSVIFLLAVGSNLLMIPHPTWMQIVVPIGAIGSLSTGVFVGTKLRTSSPE